MRQLVACSKHNSEDDDDYDYHCDDYAGYDDDHEDHYNDDDDYGYDDDYADYDDDDDGC